MIERERDDLAELWYLRCFALRLAGDEGGVREAARRALAAVLPRALPLAAWRADAATAADAVAGVFDAARATPELARAVRERTIEEAAADVRAFVTPRPPPPPPAWAPPTAPRGAVAAAGANEAGGGGGGSDGGAASGAPWSSIAKANEDLYALWLERARAARARGRLAWLWAAVDAAVEASNDVSHEDWFP